MGGSFWTDLRRRLTILLILVRLQPRGQTGPGHNNYDVRTICTPSGGARWRWRWYRGGSVLSSPAAGRSYRRPWSVGRFRSSDKRFGGRRQQLLCCARAHVCACFVHACVSACACTRDCALYVRVGAMFTLPPGAGVGT